MVLDFAFIHCMRKDLRINTKMRKAGRKCKVKK